MVLFQIGDFLVTNLIIILVIFVISLLMRALFLMFGVKKYNGFNDTFPKLLVTSIIITGCLLIVSVIFVLIDIVAVLALGISISLITNILNIFIQIKIEIKIVQNRHFTKTSGINKRYVAKGQKKSIGKEARNTVAFELLFSLIFFTIVILILIFVFMDFMSDLVNILV